MKLLFACLLLPLVQATRPGSTELHERQGGFITGAKGGLGSFVTQRFLATGPTVVGTSAASPRKDFPSPNFVPLPVTSQRARFAKQ